MNSKENTDIKAASNASQGSIDNLKTSINSVGAKLRKIDLSNLDVSVSTRATQSSVNSLQDKIIDLQFETGTPGFLLKIKIEEALRSKKNGLSIFYLPQKYGEYLESVRNTVGEAIKKNVDPGLSVPGSVYKHFNIAEYLFAAGNYKNAFARYSQSYRNLINPRKVRILCKKSLGLQIKIK